jgi:hypothetical protein
MKPTDYDTRAGCHDCHHMFRKTEYDDWPEYYCTLGDIEERPICGSVAMNESFFGSLRDEEGNRRKRKKEESFERTHVAWEKWSEARKVEAWGFCDAWEGK